MKILSRHIPGLLLLSIIYSPDIKAINPIRIDDILILIGSILILIRNADKKIIRKERLDIGKSLIKMGVACIIGIFVGGLVLGLNVVARDFMIFIQMFKYYLIYWLIGNMKYDQKTIKTYHLYVIIGLLTASIIAISQYWNIAGVNEWLTPIYFNEELAVQQMVEAEMDFRVSGTMSNPNYYGYMIIWMVGWLMSLNYYYKKMISKYVPIIILMMSAIAVLLIQSRTVIIGSIIMIMVLTYMSRSIQTKIKIISVFAVVATTVYLVYSSEGMTQRGFGERLSIGSESASRSYTARNRDLITPLMVMVEVPVIIPFGLGPSKTVIRNDSHNGYTWIAIRMGVYGMLVYMGIVYRGFIKANKIRRNKNVNWEFRSISLAYILCLIPWINGDLTGNILKEIQLMSLNMITLGWLQYAMNNSKIDYLEKKV